MELCAAVHSDDQMATRSISERGYILEELPLIRIAASVKVPLVIDENAFGHTRLDLVKQIAFR